MKLKKLIAAILGLGLATSLVCAGQDSKPVSEKLDARSYKIDINYMIPQTGPAKSVDGYSITVDGENIDSWLPYAGKATSVPYGGGKGLTFKDTIKEYKDSGWQKDKREITMTISNEEDTYQYFLTVFDNGSATLSINCRNRDGISYRGSMVLDE